MKKAFSIGMVLFVIFCISSCAFTPSFDCNFDNWSSYDVQVTDIEGGSPSSITVPAWGDKTVSIKADKISFVYSPSNYVYSVIDSSNNKVYFYAR